MGIAKVESFVLLFPAGAHSRLFLINCLRLLNLKVSHSEMAVLEVDEMENQKTRDKTFEKFTWTIQNFSKLSCEELYSENFFICGHSWRIIIFPKGNDVDFLSIYLDAGDVSKLPCGWRRFTEFKLALINQVNGKMTITKDDVHHFNAREVDWGFPYLIPLAELHDSSKGFIVKDTCIIEAEIFVDKSENEKQVDKAVTKIDVSADSPQVCAERIESGDNPLHKEMYSASCCELIDFRGLAKIEKGFVPLLDEVCSRHPSLVECLQKRTRKFIEWAFTALGRVLHFLKTKKVKDMNDDACKHLQILWEELETCRFDLTWLEPHVQSALGTKSYMERAALVKKGKLNVEALKMEKKRLKEKMASIEVDIEIAVKDLVEVVESLDAELGYGEL
ncbi:MATH domain and coiled-coil domain-containing protein At3g58370-like [Gastrolobium bilobum]|uniref:MATH domain and coiled-coil domain-containing protein At3g58370-like n=1 Tax=Gastrolobium bilobum TaxID=150636 RepID=UPI002AB1FD1C|nr:MATH domain and coiled-coil domain-containing protein At3g58370-like [Gastrolobium bilobum]